MNGNHWQGKILGMLGGGNMAEALIRGILSAKLMQPSDIVVVDPQPARRQAIANLGCRTESHPHAILVADFLLMAIKPQQFRQATQELGVHLSPKALVASIAAGVPLRVIEGLFPSKCRVIRVMPNTPLLLGMGVSVLAKGSHATHIDMAMAKQLFGCAGRAYEVEENLLDAVTALSGSGPAYLFRFAEALIRGGEALGLSSDLARELTTGMLRGSAEMLAATPDPTLLRERVTSPGGTTAAALEVFEAHNLEEMVKEAMAAAKRRGAELGREA
ncbi:MAG: pyrroline-5-carboxylate reductase [Planctomycetes bacterium]|nr:pyrroline-5-carboxylate reductase [Planctomycetota bacterium]